MQELWKKSAQALKIIFNNGFQQTNLRNARKPQKRETSSTFFALAKLKPMTEECASLVILFL